MTTPDDDPRPKYQRIADSLREAIQSGEYGPGDRLPGENDLMGTYGVARMTARQALGVLRDEGIAESRKGAGVFVLDSNAGMARRVIQASGTPTVDDLTTFLRKRVAEERRLLGGVNSPVITPGQHRLSIGGGTTALVPLGRFAAHLDAIEATLDKFDAALSHVLRAKEMGWDYDISQAAAVAYMDVIKLHALEYATHPDYKDSWRP